MKKEIIHLTELTLIYCVGDLYRGGCKPGRLKNRYDKIISLTGSDLHNMLKMSDDDRAIASGLVHEFCQDVGWLGKERHIGTVASFCLDLIEQSDFDYPKGVITALNDIIEYIWRGGNMPATSCEHAAVAGERWRKMIADIQTGIRPVPKLEVAA